MANKVLIFIQDRLIKGIVLRSLFEKNLEFVEVLDDKDLYLKLEIFKGSIYFFIVQIGLNTHKEQYDVIKRLKRNAYSGNLPVMAIIPHGTIEFVGGAKEVGIEDVILIPEKRELFRDFFTARLADFLNKYSHDEEEELPDLDEIRRKMVSSLSTNDELKRELKRAGRGKYSVSFVMGRLEGIKAMLVQDFYEKLRNELRDTDKIILYDHSTFIVVCPFTIKSFLIQVEKKTRDAFETMFGKSTRTTRLDLYGVTYPDDGKNLEKLMEILEKGVHDSIIISSIREPLNALSRERLEEYKNMLKLYK